MPVHEHGSGLGGQIFGGSSSLMSGGLDPVAESAQLSPGERQLQYLKKQAAKQGFQLTPAQGVGA